MSGISRRKFRQSFNFSTNEAGYKLEGTGVKIYSERFLLTEFEYNWLIHKTDKYNI